MKKTTLIISIFITLIIANGNYIKIQAIDYPGEVDVYAILFNNDINSNTYDALTIKENSTTNIIAPEWITSSKNQEFAYIKSQTNRKIKVWFYHNQNTSQSFTMTIGGGTYAGTGFGSIPYTSVYFPGNSSTPGYSNLTTFTFSGSVPSSVGKRQVKFVWDIVAINGENYAYNIGITGWHNYYVVLATPQSPMTTPWVPVLEYACDWAEGKTTSSDAAKKITEGIYYMADKDGDIDYNYSSYYCTDYDELKLSDFLYDIDNISNVKVNCTDCANLVNVFSAAVGCQSQNKRIWSGISTKEIDPIGSSYGWTTVSWSYHQYGWLDNVYDASIRVDKYGTPHVPTIMSQSYYNSLLINGNPPANSQIYITQIVN